MIAGYFHKGSGLGNQLHRYVAIKCLALDKGYQHGMFNMDDFKGSSFISLPPMIDMNAHPALYMATFNEKKVIENGVDIRGYDPEFNFMKDFTVVDGEFQDERYFEHRLPEIDEWLKVEEIEMPDNVCVINFRGGEYRAVNDLFLTKDYWDSSISMMIEKYPDIQFEIHTDDPEFANAYFEFKYKCISNIGINWRSIRYAKHLILSNSSFAILPALLNKNVKEVIAPRYWARRNTGVWALPQNYYKGWKYI